MLKVLNLYAGIGGNRKLWEDVEVTAVELNEEIAEIYHEYFPFDNLVIGDAHNYLLKHYTEYDFIWSSPPCERHSMNNNFLNSQGIIRYPDMKLYEEIIFLSKFSKCKYVVENVKPYYSPLIQPNIELDRHFFWSNYKIPVYSGEIVNINGISANDTVYGFSLNGRKLKHRKDKIIRSCVNPELGLYILDCARGIINRKNKKQTSLFNEL